MGNRLTKSEMTEQANRQYDVVPGSACMYAGNTIAFRTAKGGQCWIFHQTVIVEQNKAGKITLNSGGWHTVTTKARINNILGELGRSLFIVQRKSQWFLEGIGQDSVPFKDGMTL